MESRHSARLLVEVLFCALVAQIVLVTSVSAHGYINSPPSRSYNCKTGAATDCGEIQYEPQSIEAIKGLPFKRTASSSGTLCSAGIARFSQLDRQSTNSWPSSSAADLTAFTWTFTALHATTNFQYFITKSDWNKSGSSNGGGLDASDLESTPFLTVDMNGRPPGASETHNVGSLPSRTGYHIVYAVWTVDNTDNAFYQCIDLNFPSSGSSASTTSSSDTTTSNTGSKSTNTSNSDTTTSNAGSNSTAKHKAQQCSSKKKRTAKHRRPTRML